MSEKQPVTPTEEQVTITDLLRRVGKTLINNWPLKLTSLVLAIVLWASLIAQDPDLTREKVFPDISISITGSDTMKRNGYIVVSDINAALTGAYLKADVPQLQYNNASASAYNARIDLSRVNGSGLQSVRVSTTNSITYGSVTEVYPETIDIQVEEYITRTRIPVNINTVGGTPNGYYASAPTADPMRLAVSGPASVVNSIARAEATLDLSTLPAREGVVRKAIRFDLYDNDGEKVNTDLLEITSESILIDSIIAEQTLYSMHSISVSDFSVISGTPADGYEVTSVSMTPSAIDVAGKADQLTNFEEMPLENTVSVNGATTSFSESVKVRKYSDVVYMNPDSVTVNVEIAPIRSSRTYIGVKVNVIGLGNGLKYSYNTAKCDVIVYGSQNWLKTLTSASLTLDCDLTGFTEGSYELPLKLTIANPEEGYTYSILPETIPITILSR